MNKFLPSLLLAFCLGLPACAAADPPEAAPVTALDNALVAVMKAGSAGQNFAAREAMLDPVVKQSFNLPLITQNSVGFLWSTLPAAQQQQLQQVLEQFTVVSYVSEFSAYAGEQFNLLPAEKTVGAAKVVETQLVPGGGGAPTELDYIVADGSAGWQITDVLLNGTISQVSIHESDFSGLVNSGDASPLISALQKKISTLESGGDGH